MTALLRALRALCILLILPLAGCVHSTVSGRIDVGGYRLNYKCSGSGLPTVVMDSGLGNAMDTWGEIAPGVGKVTRVCTYDRAGLGHSDPGQAPRTSEQIVKELYALLSGATVPPPYILVGHSFGGLNVRLYASEHPQSVAGLILVDATHEDYPARESELRSEAEKRKLQNMFLQSKPAARSEFDSLPQSAAQVRAAPKLPDVPLVVITAGHRDESPALNDAWLEMQTDLVNKTSQGRQIIANDSGHYVQFDQPGIVIDAITRMVEQVRAAKPALQGKNGRLPKSH